MPVGIWAITVQECADINLDAYSDPTEPPQDKLADPAHGGIDLRDIAGNKSQILTRAKQLLDLALQRGAEYRPASSAVVPADVEE